MCVVMHCRTLPLVLPLLLALVLCMGAFSALAHAEDEYADYLGRWQIWNEDAEPGEEETIEFSAEDGWLVGRPNRPELPLLLLMPGPDGLLIGEARSQTDPGEITPVTVELLRNKDKLLLTFAPPESEYVHVLAVRHAE